MPFYFLTILGEFPTHSKQAFSPPYYNGYNHFHCTAYYTPLSSLDQASTVKESANVMPHLIKVWSFKIIIPFYFEVIIGTFLHILYPYFLLFSIFKWFCLNPASIVQNSANVLPH